MPNLTLAEVMSIAEKASAHARSRILRGATQLENNQLLEEHVVAHWRAVKEVRRRAEQVSRHASLSKFEALLKLTGKYSVGNCTEYAYQALDYVLCNDKQNVRAELYRIKGGDHCFMVVNRRHDSNPSDPATWGEAAVICDPWSDAVYPASEYLSKLKNYYRIKNDDNGLFKNHIQDFDQSVHQLKPLHVYNTDELRPKINSRDLYATFTVKLMRVKEALTIYRELLLEEITRLAKQYGDNHAKVILLTKKIQHADNVLGVIEIQFAMGCIDESSVNYLRDTTERNKDYKDICQAAISAMSFKPAEIKLLSAHTCRSTFKRRLFSLFGVRTKSARKLDVISAKVNDKLQEGQAPVSQVPDHHYSSFGGWGFVMGYYAGSR